jgi:hypothetical protein
VTLKRGQNSKYLPDAFTKRGAIMADDEPKTVPAASGILSRALNYAEWTPFLAFRRRQWL